ncbi:MAG: exosortase/archaeosortase family protein, partial [Candidatus Nezhaarchaeota archaeon]|nr:exosortase/archaeosortase family protein [Candidatus Nezhaarchaeota archaeon]
TSSLAPRLAHLQDELLYSWVTLSACLLWLVLKRRAIARDLSGRVGVLASPGRVVLGFTLCAASLAVELAFRAQDFFYALAPASMFISGVFAALGSLVPLAVSSAYLAGVVLPDVIGRFADRPLSELAASATALALRALGVQASAHGAYLRIPTAAGGVISAYIDHVCAGSTSLSVFVCLFALITVDLQPRPSWKIAAFLAAGCLGVLAQATLRLILMGVVGASYGLAAFLTAHKYLGYALFLLYFTSFTYIYIRSARRATR